MTRFVALTMLEYTEEQGNEYRDCIDQRWIALLAKCGFGTLLLPNHPFAVKRMLELPIAGIVLSGGGEAPGLIGPTTARHRVEEIVCDHASAKNLPVLGICRGMQALLAMDGFRAQPIVGHVGIRHEVVGDLPREVNSFHNLGFRDAPGDYEVRARAPDGSVEWAQDDRRARMGIMWHPERERPFQQRDIDMIVHWFARD